MDSFEKMRKMTDISKELKKHGLVKDTNEAIRRAEEMVISEETKMDAEFYVPQDNFHKVKTEQPSHIQQNAPSAPDFDDKLSRLSSELLVMRSKMNEVIAKINELETKMKDSPRQEVQATLAPPAPEIKREEPKAADEKPAYKQSDVAIDRIFYMGKK